MPTPFDFMTLQRAADRLKVPTTDGDLPGIIAAASLALANWLGYDAHLRESVEETVPSEGGVYLWLASGAVRRVLSVTVGGTELDASNYHLESPTQGRLVRRTGGWPFTGTYSTGISSTALMSHDTGLITVRFDAGWRTPGQVAPVLEADPSSTLKSDLPAELEEAALITLAALYRPAGRDPNVIARTAGAGSVTWRSDPSVVPTLARQLAGRHYKHHRRKA
ncbi:hypothetical protein [Vitiosangium sp. GDMCC 1.1324]|uniref:hypothetical protein n=1 Tax=Vitiosangium sp. (strain GDMCC 1.1324) TaxID=2138576 RepID=UPI000D3BA232|nr:hypothetical protein [Vitiosangium sp. GDMCC 1.1324]PTL79094.1 hypothetical protein DAT35_36405 [Vitiosangium sp. GDMCC 1.1324]